MRRAAYVMILVSAVSVAAVARADEKVCPTDPKHTVRRGDNFCMECGAKLVVKAKSRAKAKPKPGPAKPGSAKPGPAKPAARPASPDAVAMALVPAGKLLMGSAADAGQADERPAHEVQLDAFELDLHEVTVARYGVCVAAGRCAAPGAGTGCNAGADGRGEHPANCVDWNQAAVYCAWAAKRLPTEAEWERAARGDEARPYPWGNEAPSCARAVISDGGHGCGRDATWPVGSKPSGASPFGVHDLSGNVWEWVADWYDREYYAKSPPRSPPGPAVGKTRVLRGGGFTDATPGNLRAANRDHAPPGSRSRLLGFRCARTPTTPR
ncbi:MAG TPA: SUMF1/EgtB/PvdO family nonheme iron enzyme [Polyangia bacterium]|jgi:formylglycine-generating enzyme required for sulfatase activity